MSSSVVARRDGAADPSGAVVDYESARVHADPSTEVQAPNGTHSDELSQSLSLEDLAAASPQAEAAGIADAAAPEESEAVDGAAAPAAGTVEEDGTEQEEPGKIRTTSGEDARGARRGTKAKATSAARRRRRSTRAEVRGAALHASAREREARLSQRRDAAPEGCTFRPRVRPSPGSRRSGASEGQERFESLYTDSKMRSERLAMRRRAAEAAVAKQQSPHRPTLVASSERYLHREPRSPQVAAEELYAEGIDRRERLQRLGDRPVPDCTFSPDVEASTAILGAARRRHGEVFDSLYEDALQRIDEHIAAIAAEGRPPSTTQRRALRGPQAQGVLPQEHKLDAGGTASRSTPPGSSGVARAAPSAHSPSAQATTTASTGEPQEQLQAIAQRLLLLHSVFFGTAALRWGSSLCERGMRFLRECGCFDRQEDRSAAQLTLASARAVLRALPDDEIPSFEEFHGFVQQIATIIFPAAATAQAALQDFLFRFVLPTAERLVLLHKAGRRGGGFLYAPAHIRGLCCDEMTDVLIERDATFRRLFERILNDGSAAAPINGVVELLEACSVVPQLVNRDQARVLVESVARPTVGGNPGSNAMQVHRANELPYSSFVDCLATVALVAFGDVDADTPAAKVDALATLVEVSVRGEETMASSRARPAEAAHRHRGSEQTTRMTTSNTTADTSAATAADQALADAEAALARPYPAAAARAARTARAARRSVVDEGGDAMPRTAVPPVPSPAPRLRSGRGAQVWGGDSGRMSAATPERRPERAIAPWTVRSHSPSTMPTAADRPSRVIHESAGRKHHDQHNRSGSVSRSRSKSVDNSSDREGISVSLPRLFRASLNRESGCLSAAQFLVFCRDARLISNSVGYTDVLSAFRSSLPRGHRELDFDHFISALRRVVGMRFRAAPAHKRTDSWSHFVATHLPSVTRRGNFRFRTMTALSAVLYPAVVDALDQHRPAFQFLFVKYTESSAALSTQSRPRLASLVPEDGARMSWFAFVSFLSDFGVTPKLFPSIDEVARVVLQAFACDAEHQYEERETSEGTAGASGGSLAADTVGLARNDSISDADEFDVDVELARELAAAAELQRQLNEADSPQKGRLHNRDLSSETVSASDMQKLSVDFPRFMEAVVLLAQHAFSRAEGSPRHDRGSSRLSPEAECASRIVKLLRFIDPPGLLFRPKGYDLAASSRSPEHAAIRDVAPAAPSVSPKFPVRVLFRKLSGDFDSVLSERVFWRFVNRSGLLCGWLTQWAAVRAFREQRADPRGLGVGDFGDALATVVKLSVGSSDPEMAAEALLSHNEDWVDTAHLTLAPRCDDELVQPELALVSEEFSGALLSAFLQFASVCAPRSRTLGRGGGSAEPALSLTAAPGLDALAVGEVAALQFAQSAGVSPECLALRRVSEIFAASTAVCHPKLRGHPESAVPPSLTFPGFVHFVSSLAVALGSDNGYIRDATEVLGSLVRSDLRAARNAESDATFELNMKAILGVALRSCELLTDASADPPPPTDASVGRSADAVGDEEMGLDELLDFFTGVAPDGETWQVANLRDFVVQCGLSSPPEAPEPKFRDRVTLSPDMVDAAVTALNGGRTIHSSTNSTRSEGSERSSSSTGSVSSSSGGFGTPTSADSPRGGGRSHSRLAELTTANWFAVLDLLAHKAFPDREASEAEAAFRSCIARYVRRCRDHGWNLRHTDGDVLAEPKRIDRRHHPQGQPPGGSAPGLPNPGCAGMSVVIEAALRQLFLRYSDETGGELSHSAALAFVEDFLLPADAGNVLWTERVLELTESVEDVALTLFATSMRRARPSTLHSVDATAFIKFVQLLQLSADSWYEHCDTLPSRQARLDRLLHAMDAESRLFPPIFRVVELISSTHVAEARLNDAGLSSPGAADVASPATPRRSPSPPSPADLDSVRSGSQTSARTARSGASVGVPDSFDSGLSELRSLIRDDALAELSANASLLSALYEKLESSSSPRLSSVLELLTDAGVDNSLVPRGRLAAAVRSVVTSPMYMSVVVDGSRAEEPLESVLTPAGFGLVVCLSAGVMCGVSIDDRTATSIPAGRGAAGDSEHSLDVWDVTGVHTQLLLTLLDSAMLTDRSGTPPRKPRESTSADAGSDGVRGAPTRANGGAGADDDTEEVRRSGMAASSFAVYEYLLQPSVVSFTSKYARPLRAAFRRYATELDGELILQLPEAEQLVRDFELDPSPYVLSMTDVHRAFHACRLVESDHEQFAAIRETQFLEFIARIALQRWSRQGKDGDGADAVCAVLHRVTDGLLLQMQ